jgi:hypothetical protein
VLPACLFLPVFALYAALYAVLYAALYVLPCMQSCMLSCMLQLRYFQVVCCLVYSLVCCLVCCEHCVMSEHGEEFDIKLWYCELKLSEVGIKKLLLNEINDLTLLCDLSVADITDLKLNVGDRRRLLDAITKIRKVSQTKDPEVADSERKQEQPGIETSERQVGVDGQTNFSISEVANFLAGNAVPANVQASVANLRGQGPVASPVIQPQRSPLITDASRQQGYVNSQLPYPQFDTLEQNRTPSLGQLPYNPYQNLPIYGRQSSYGSQVSGQAYNPAVNFNPVGNFNPAGNFSPYYNPGYSPAGHFNNNQSAYGTIPFYSPQRHPCVPGRLANINSLNRNSALCGLADGYQQTNFHDLLSINQANPGYCQQGENLYLPCNFVSHVRGSSRAEDEELLSTTNGTKLYFAQGNKKILPEKLSYGLFFGANARILARLIPNASPELAAYLDYLRKLGDLMVNYTASSVFLLDHEHRFEVIEIGKSFNCIDSSLSLNILKKREVVADTRKSDNTVSRVSNSDQGSNQRANRRPTVICWLYNQAEGCSYHPNCRFLHICNVVGCGMSHPAVKHIFRGQGNPQRSQSQSQPQQAITAK